MFLNFSLHTTQMVLSAGMKNLDCLLSLCSLSSGRNKLGETVSERTSRGKTVFLSPAFARINLARSVDRVICSPAEQPKNGAASSLSRTVVNEVNWWIGYTWSEAQQSVKDRFKIGLRSSQDRVKFSERKHTRKYSLSSCCNLQSRTSVNFCSVSKKLSVRSGNLKGPPTENKLKKQNICGPLT